MKERVANGICKRPAEPDIEKIRQVAVWNCIVVGWIGYESLNSVVWERVFSC